MRLMDTIEAEERLCLAVAKARQRFGSLRRALDAVAVKHRCSEGYARLCYYRHKSRLQFSDD